MLKLIWLHVELRIRFALVFGILTLAALINPIWTAALTYSLLEERRWMGKALRRYNP